MALICGAMALVTILVTNWIIEPIAIQALGGNSNSFLNEIAASFSPLRQTQLAGLWESLLVNLYVGLAVIAFGAYAVPYLSKSKEGSRFDSLSILSLLWACSILVHQAHKGYLVRFSDDTVLTLIAVWVLFKPSSLSRFVTLLVVELTCFILTMPNVVNHWIFMAFGACSILLCLWYARVRAQGGAFERDVAFKDIAMVLRAQLVILYILATLAKLNWSYFDPDYSSAAALLDILRDRIHIIPNAPWVYYAAIYGSLLAEILIPLLLVLPRTRLFGIWFGWTFHLFLGMAGYPDFSIVVFLYYFVFTVDDLSVRLSIVYDRYPSFKQITTRIGHLMRPAWVPVSLFVGLFALAILGQLARFDVVGSQVLYLRVTRVSIMALWLVFSGFIAVSLYLALKEKGVRDHSYSFNTILKPVFIVGPLLVLLNGISPYLGLKTENTFTMFSDLKTEGDHWNHVFVPESVRIFQFQTELVRIHESSDPVFQGYAEGPELLTYQEFRRLAYQRPNDSVSYQFEGQDHVVSRIGDNPELSKPLPLLVRKFMSYRPVAIHENRKHRH